MIGEKLKQRLTELGLTQQRAADQLEISQSRLNQYLKDKREPDSQMLCKICRTFDITPNWLYGFEDTVPNKASKLNKKALETAVLFLKKYEESHKKVFSVEKSARVITVVYEIIVSETEENAQKAIDWVIEAAVS